MKLVLIRHFPTKGNCLKQYIGRTDEPLDFEFAEKILNEIGDVKSFYPMTDCVITSPMLRCIQTAELLYPGIQRFSCDKLRETDFGDFEGRTYEELKQREDYQQWLISGAAGKVPNGESRAEFVARCIEGFHDVMNRLLEEKCGNAAIVVHGGTIMALMSEFAEKAQDFYHWQVKNGKGYEVEIKPEEWLNGRKSFQNIRKL